MIYLIIENDEIQEIDEYEAVEAVTVDRPVWIICPSHGFQRLTGEIMCPVCQPTK